MARNRNDIDQDREYDSRQERFRRERPWGYDDPYAGRSRSLAGDYGRGGLSRGRFGERADYDYDEPRYYSNPGRSPEESYGRTSNDERRDYMLRRQGEYERPARSRIRCRDIMTRELSVATRDTTLREVAILMKEEDTGVIPVVDYHVPGGNGKTTDSPRGNTNSTKYGKLVGLITDRDLVVRGIAEDKDWATTRAEEVMSTDLQTARPNDRVVDVIRKMGDKQVRRIPVVGESGNLLGIISMRDIAVETEADSELAEALEDISKGPSFWERIFH